MPSSFGTRWSADLVKNSPKMHRSGWKEAQLLIAFHTFGGGLHRERARAWPPRNALGRIHGDPTKQETFVEVRAFDRRRSPVQIKLRRSELIIACGDGHVCDGLVIRENSIVVGLGERRLNIGPDGSLDCDDGRSSIYLGRDGEVRKTTRSSGATISAAGDTLISVTNGNVSVIFPGGILRRDL